MNIQEVCSLIKDLEKIRVLENNFTHVSGERKTHFLLTTTPKGEFPDERYQMGGNEIVSLRDRIVKVLKELL